MFSIDIGDFIFTLVMGVAGVFIRFWFANLEKKIQELCTEIKSIKQNYQSKEIAEISSRHLNKNLQEIKDQLNDINRKLDMKADK